MSALNQSDNGLNFVMDNADPSEISQILGSTANPTKEDLSPLGYNIAAVCLFFIMVFGCFNNIVVIIVVAGTKKLRTPMNAILLNLSVSDFIISLFGTPMSFASAINRNWFFGSFLCEIYAFCMTLTDNMRDKCKLLPNFMPCER
ncbi:g_PROTEIN_RECEP_F1_2 domain-containing protein [Caerostris darwini]|uniref:G_PROTEIN_RECEP_F1_2 domain-containing protein n=1 Tax=Caerostris darwini TaxID=1538125 RepID=A0AAV4T6B7_9ARAC|nr:g_PROTEIN_RECEP_F1_2 domain-containing protein [Caerostris darwini]